MNKACVTQCHTRDVSCCRSCERRIRILGTVAAWVGIKQDLVRAQGGVAVDSAYLLPLLTELFLFLITNATTAAVTTAPRTRPATTPTMSVVG